MEVLQRRSRLASSSLAALLFVLLLLAVFDRASAGPNLIDHEERFEAGSIRTTDTDGRFSVCILASAVPARNSCDFSASLVFEFLEPIFNYTLSYRAAPGLREPEPRTKFFRGAIASRKLSLSIFENHQPLHGWDIRALLHFGNVSAVVAADSLLTNAWLRIVTPPNRCSWVVLDQSTGTCMPVFAAVSAVDSSATSPLLETPIAIEEKEHSGALGVLRPTSATDIAWRVICLVLIVAIVCIVPVWSRFCRKQHQPVTTIDEQLGKPPAKWKEVSV